MPNELSIYAIVKAHKGPITYTELFKEVAEKGLMQQFYKAGTNKSNIEYEYTIK